MTDQWEAITDAAHQVSKDGGRELAGLVIQADDLIEALEDQINGAHEIILSERAEVLRLRERIEELEVKIKTLSQAQREARNEALDEAAELCVQMTGTPRYGRNIRAMMEDDNT